MAKRVNYRLFSILTVVVLGAGLAALVAPVATRKFIRPGKGDAKKLIAEGDQLFGGGQFGDARKKYELAIRADANNTEALVKYGDSAAKLVGEDPANLTAALNAWNRAISINPRQTDAINRLLDSYWDYIEMGAMSEEKAGLFAKCRGLADKLLVAEPQNKRAAARKHISTVRQWLVTGTVPMQDVLGSISALEELANKNPADPEPAAWVARAKLRQAQEDLGTGQTRSAQLKFLEVTELFDKARTAQPENGPLHYRAFQVYTQLDQTDPATRTATRDTGNATKDAAKDATKDATKDAAKDATADPKKDPKDASKGEDLARGGKKDDRYLKRAGEAIQAAQRTTTPKDELYGEIQEAAADWYARQGDKERARQIVQALYDGHKDDQRARLAMARMLASPTAGTPTDANPEARADAKVDPASREKAIQILSQDLADDKTAGGFKLLWRRELQARTAFELGMLRLQSYAATVEAQEQSKRAATQPAGPAVAAEGPAAEARLKAMESAINQTIDQLRRLSSNKAYHVRSLEGRFYLLKGNNIEAVRALEDAVKASDESVRSKSADPDYELMYLLARAYEQTRQPGMAKAQLERVVAGLPGWTAARIQLAGITLNEGEIEGARRHVNVLKAQVPDNPQVREMDRILTVLARQDNKQEADTAYGRMPEETVEQRVRKAQLALVLDKPDEAIRLLRRNIQENPRDVRAVQDLAGIYERRAQRERARQVVEEGLKNNPGDLTLKLTSLRLADSPQEKIYAEMRPLVEQTADEATREMQLYDLERLPGGHPDQALGHLERAGQLRPGDRQILQVLYAAHVQKQDWAKAESCLNELIKQGADQFGGLLYRQRFALAKGDFDNAERLGLQLVEQYKEFGENWLALAQAQQALGKFEEAARSYAEARRRQPKQYAALKGLIDCLYQSNRPEEAKTHLAEGRQLFPTDVTIRELYLTHLVSYGNPADAIPERVKLLETEKEDPLSWLNLAGTYFRAGQYVAPNDPRGMVEYFKKAYETLAKGAQKFPDDGRFYAQQAEMAQYGGRADEGEKLLRDFARRESVRDKPLPFLMLADHFIRTGQLAKAEQSLGDALVKADRDEALEIRLRLAAVLTQEKKYKEAAATLNGAGRDDEPRVVQQRIENLIAANDMTGAMEETDKAMKKQDSVALRNLKASILIDTSRAPDAFAELAVAQRMEPRNEFTRFLHAMALAKQPQPELKLAINELIEVRNRNQRNVQARLVLAELYTRTNQLNMAIRELADTLQKVPLARDARLALIKLYQAQQPPDFGAALNLCLAAEKDPVLKQDAAWPREKAMINLAQKNLPNAIFFMDQVVRMAPENMEYQRERLDVLLQLGQFDAVLRESDKLIQRQQDYWWLRHQRGLAYAKQPVPDHARALAEFDRGLQMADQMKDGDTAEFILRGMAGAITQAQANGALIPVGYDEAIARVKARLAGDVDNRWHLLLASLYRGKGDFENAAQVADAMLADPANRTADRRAPVLRAAGDIFHNAPRPDYRKARAAYVELLKLTPEDLTALNNMACLLAENFSPPDPREAKRYSSKAFDLLRLSGSRSDVLDDTHGWVLALCGGDDATQGLKILRELVDRRPDFLEGHYHLAMAYLHQTPPSPVMAKQELGQTLQAADKMEKAGQAVDPGLKSKIQVALDQLDKSGKKPNPGGGGSNGQPGPAAGNAAERSATAK